MKTVTIKAGFGAHTTKDGVIHRAGDAVFQVSDEEFGAFQVKFNEVAATPVEVKAKVAKKEATPTGEDTKAES